MKLDAATIAKMLGGKPEGGGYLCSCPVKGHGKGRGDLRPSLSVSDGKRTLVFHCFAGCKPRDIVVALNALTPDLGPRRRFESRLPQRFATKSKTTSTLAQKLWKAALPVAGTPAEIYLRSRRLPPIPPPTIRFLPSYRYDETRRFPCLIAAVQAPSRAIAAVQLTFLDASGLRKADVPHPRRAIGSLGDGLLRLAPAAEHIGLAEGFETALAASLLHENFPVWATLGADRYAKISLPPIVRRLTIFADYDAPGLSAALSFFERRVELEVWIATPTTVGDDFARALERRLEEEHSRQIEHG
jgi:putative DNA primase/helicase